MQSERVQLTKEEAIAMLPEGEHIHTFRGGAGIAIGCDMDRADIITLFEKFTPELSGPTATAMKHGIVLNDGSALFIATK